MILQSFFVFKCFSCFFWSDICFFFFLMIRRPPRHTRVRSSAASDVYKRQGALDDDGDQHQRDEDEEPEQQALSLIHISEPTRLLSISYAVFCLKKKKKK